MLDWSLLGEGDEMDCAWALFLEIVCLNGLVSPSSSWSVYLRGWTSDKLVGEIEDNLCCCGCGSDVIGINVLFSGAGFVCNRFGLAKEMRGNMLFVGFCWILRWCHC